MIRQTKLLEIFCGTGGVGKTTLACSRALHLSKQGKKVLLITIDPSKRLKQILKMQDNNSGQIQTISNSIFSNDNAIESKETFDALLMSPEATLKQISNDPTSVDSETKFNNRILKIITKPHGGLNEIMSIVELHHQYKKNIYDTIILDTPPGKHFIDFLQSATKINNFFDKSFVEIFKYLDSSNDQDKPKKRASLFTVFISSGVKKLLSYLEKVTGKEFVHTFIDAILTIYKSKKGFTQAMEMSSILKDKEFSNWILVTSTMQHKVEEAQELKSNVADFSHIDKYLVINKSLLSTIEKWEPKGNELLTSLKENMLKNELKLHEYAASQIEAVLEFPEILAPTPREHVRCLSELWC